MIYGCLSQDITKMGLHPALVKALTFLKTTEFSDVPAGSYELEGRSIFYNVDEVETCTADQVDPESHRQYVDIHVTLVGHEEMGFTMLRDSHTVVRENGNDGYFYARDIRDEGHIDCPVGYFAIFFPTDIHRPLISPDGQPHPLRKVVAKVAVDLLVQA